MTHTIRVTYLFDPLCGWCYGASPTLEALAAEPGVAVDLVPTGLFAGEGARPMDAQFAAYAWANDQRIARLTGQTFSEAYRSAVLGGHGRPFDSGPATLALTAVRLTRPDQELAALKAIQHARYVDGRDNADTVVLADVLRALGLAAAERLVAPDAALLAAARDRVAAGRADMRRFGLDGVPSLVVGEGEARRPVGGHTLFGGIGALLARLRAV